MNEKHYPNNKDDICAVVTTYRPDKYLPSRIEKLASNVGFVIIVDDGATLENRIILQLWIKDNSKIDLMHNLENVGIAKSLNLGVKKAISKGYQWFLMLDDDSIINDNMVEKLCSFLKEIKTEKPIGLIGMNWCNLDESVLKSKNEKKHYVDKRGIITSGSLLSKDVYRKIGKFREEFIIDMVDYDYALRCRLKGYRVIMINEIGFKHGYGNKISRNILGKQIHIITHNPERLYYSQRNSTVLAKEYLKHDPLYSLAVFYYQIKSISQIIILEDDKINKLFHMIRGYIDGWRGRLGKIRVTKSN